MTHPGSPATAATPSDDRLRGSSGGRLVAVRDTQLYVRTEGSGPTLVFVHGMCGDAEVWTDQVRRLSDRFTCVAYDRRGHSRSPAGTRDQSYATHADDVAALIETLRLGGCTLVGSSGGAYVGFELLRRHPGAVRAAVLSEPPLFPLDPAAGAALQRDVAPAVDAAVASRGPRAAVDAFFEVVCPGLWKAIDEGRRDRYRANAPMLRAALTEPADPVDAAILGDIAVPVLVLTGSESHPALRTIAARLAGGLPEASLVELPGSGHVTYAEQPAAFEAAVRAFAGSVAAPTRG